MTEEPQGREESLGGYKIVPGKTDFVIPAKAGIQPER